MSLLGNLNNALEQIDCGYYNDAMSSICEAKEKLQQVTRTLEVIRDNPDWQDHHCRAENSINNIL